LATLFWQPLSSWFYARYHIALVSECHTKGRVKKWSGEHTRTGSTAPICMKRRSAWMAFSLVVDRPARHLSTSASEVSPTWFLSSAGHALWSRRAASW
jgi:hypothetical protein